MKKYIQLYNYLRDAIECGDWAPQMQLPTESALSEQFQMSRQTVRQALAALKNDNYIYSVRGSGSFVSPCAGKKAENKRIAVVTTYFSEYIFPSILRGICNVAVEHGYAVELSSSNNSIKQERAILTQLMENSVAGIIVEGTKTTFPNPNAEIYKKLADSGTPVVFINSIYYQIKDSSFPSVVVDDYNGGYEQTKYILAQGHTHIASFFKIDDVQGYYRFQGMLDALTESGVDFDDRNFLFYTTETKNSLISLPPFQKILTDCTALLCYNDEIVELLLPLLKDSPNKISILASFDQELNTNLIPQHVEYRSLLHPKERLGQAAAEKLFNILAGQKEGTLVLPWGEG